MDEPSWQWPAWKFGMKREDLFTKLHDQYNTIPSSIQDPEAFHHDVYEISTTASSPTEFHRLLAERKALRLRELNESLESAAVEIIANPDLIGTEQWQHAIQLFRTRSLDSLVRYYSSYLPDEHPWRTSNHTTATAQVPVDDVYIFDSSDDDIYDRVTYEPKHITTDIPASHMPLSPRSSTMSSDLSGSALSPIELSDSELAFDLATPSRAASYADTENDLVFSATLTAYDDEEDFSQTDDHLSPPTSVSDYDETRSLPDTSASYTDDEVPTTSCSFTPAACDETDDGGSESETPTPRKEAPSDSYLSCRSAGNKFSTSSSASSAAMRRSQSASSLYTQVLAEYVRGHPRRSHRDASPGGFHGSGSRRRSPELGRVQKPSTEFSVFRSKYRRRAD
ncbi:uncharacterized protein B0I36DRAFT_82513 [Microdochium trichocladiopsis]|uniref:Uncharacterized protein n=1 Tax=Microdochium trichocladiopsis TaxID=1682393 RepID=A0A9P8YAY1_9PEZI|nr:uncharacterized protein B0I36DRAFT_82513 [Microdochium trichocladiopsis]KAH7034615.1 hypothetical protein B0I36DRAFT_82513 [Microdochium trichocladiopsis]